MSSPSASNVNDTRKVVEEVAFVSNNFNNASAKLLPLRSNSPVNALRSQVKMDLFCRTLKIHLIKRTNYLSLHESQIHL